MSENKGENAKKDAGDGGKQPFAKRLGCFLDIPTDLLCGGCYLEMRGQSDLHLQGCRRIAAYADDEIVLRLRRGWVRVRGHRLVCASYHAGKLVINGWITGIDFSGTEGES